MSDGSAPSVFALVERLDAIERETESIYLRLGTIFPELQEAVDHSAHEAEKSIHAILEVHRGGVSSEVARRRSAEFIEDSVRFFEQASRAESRFFGGVETGIAGLSTLDGIIDRVRADSEEMEILSLNAMTVALKSGASGRAFSVITDELKRLSGMTIQHAGELSNAGSTLLSELGTLKALLADLAARQESFFGAVRSALEGGFVALDARIDGTAAELRSLLAEASGVRGPVTDIMQGVQLQDIIRQSLDHVRLSLRASDVDGDGEANREDAEERAFLAEITRLSSTLLDDVHNQVRSSVAQFNASMDGIAAVMASVEKRRSERSTSPEGAAAAVDFGRLSSGYLAAKDSAAVHANRIADGVRRLDERFRLVYGILSRFRNIVTASRIETARNKALAIVANTVAGMMDLTERLAADIAAAGDVTRSFAKNLNAGLSEYVGGSADERESLVQGLGRLQAEFERLESARRELDEAEASFRPFSAGVGEALAGAAREMDHIGTLADELAAMRDTLAGYASSAESAAGGASAAALAIRNERLKEIVERFTIFTHRQTANRIANLGGAREEAGAGSGDVTFF